MELVKSDSDAPVVWPTHAVLLQRKQPGLRYLKPKQKVECAMKSAAELKQQEHDEDGWIGLRHFASWSPKWRADQSSELFA